MKNTALGGYKMNRNKKTTTDQGYEIIQTRLEKQAEKVTKHHEPIKNTHKKTRPPYVTKKIKDERYAQTIEQIQSTEPVAYRYISKLVHQKYIYSFSELLEKTLFRPYTILLDTVLTLFASIALVRWANQIGLDYQPTVFIIIFVLLFPLCLAIDLLGSLIHKYNNRYR